MIWRIIMLGALATVLVYAASLLPTGERGLGVVENIHGIPYPRTESGMLTITEELAHADIYLQEPVLGKQLTMQVIFQPTAIRSLRVGVRENSFWLSYPDSHVLYTSDTRAPETSSITQTITIPLTDKLQSADRSLDLMFFAENGGQDVVWQLESITVATGWQRPTLAQLKDYVRSIVTRERPL